jgi:uncharacterized protein (DUF486 family)
VYKRTQCGKGGGAIPQTLTKQAANLINSIVHFVMTPANKLSETARTMEKKGSLENVVPFLITLLISLYWVYQDVRKNSLSTCTIIESNVVTEQFASVGEIKCKKW